MQQQQRIGRYEVLGEIASGGQATVYRARDASLDRVVALKVMHAHLTRDAAYLERFLREARIAAGLTHPNNVVIHEVGQDGDRHFIAMEYLPMSLSGMLKERGPLPEGEAVSLVRQMALALEMAHRRDVIHRDMKPQNVLITEDGVPKVTDFGIARAGELATMTATGMIMGTPQYMSPEQARGERVDPRTDVYALGIILLECLTGHTPLEGKTPQDVMRHHLLNQETPMDALDQMGVGISPGLRDVLRRTLAQDPEHRFATAGALAEALEQLHQQSATTPATQIAVPPTPAPQVPTPTPPQAPISTEPETPGERYCPNCGNPVHPGVKFCAVCGKDLAAIGESQEVPGEEGQRQGAAPVVPSPEAPARPQSSALGRVVRAIALLIGWAYTGLVVFGTLIQSLDAEYQSEEYALSTGSLIIAATVAVIVMLAAQFRRRGLMLIIPPAFFRPVPRTGFMVFSLLLFAVAIGALNQVESGGATPGASGIVTFPPVTPTPAPATPTAFVPTPFPIVGGSATESRILEFVATEFAFSPALATISQGDVGTVTLVNKGTIVHTLEIPELGVSTGEVQPGETVSVEFKAGQSGAYEFFCSIPGHRDAGMAGKLVIAPATPLSMATPAPTMVPVPVQPQVLLEFVATEFEFMPNLVTISQGDVGTITLINKGFIAHTLEIPELGVSTSEIQPGETVSVDFKAGQSGAFEYFCRILGHRDVGMVGKLVVSDATPLPVRRLTSATPRPFSTSSTLPAGTVLGTYAVGNLPLALVFDGKSIWVGNFDDDTVTKLALDGTVLGTYAVGGAPLDLAFDGESIWVANLTDSTVTKLALDGTVLGTYAVGGAPLDLAFDGDSVWVANWSDNTVTKVALDGTVLGTYTAGDTLGALTFGRDSIWVANRDGGTVTRLALDGTVLDTYAVGAGPTALTYDGESIWVANVADGTVTRLALDGTILGAYAVGDGPNALAIDGESIWVANLTDNTVTKLALDGTVLGTYATGDFPAALAFDGSNIWVANRDDGTVMKLAGGGG